MAENPFASVLNPNAARTGMYDMRMMQMANRSESPFERMGHSYAHQGIGGNPMLSQIAGMGNQPDYSQFTYDPAMRAQAQAYGVHPLEANQVQSNTILPNSGFFGNHPRLSGVLEAGVYGALAAHGGATVGDSIQGALEGLVGGRRLQEGAWARQFAKPFEAAGMMEGLEDAKQRRDLQGAQIKHYKDEADIQQERVALEAQRNQIGLDRINATRPVPDASGTWVYGQGSAQKPMNITQPWDTPIGGSQGGWQHVPEGGKAGARLTDHDLDIGTREQLVIAGVNPLNATPAQVGAANKKAQAQAIARSGGIAGAGADARLPYQNYQDARKEHDKTVDGYRGKMLKSDDPNHIASARESLINAQISAMMQAGASGGTPAPLHLPSDTDVKGYIKQQNDATQKQIDDENTQFNQKWPQALEAPRTKGGKTSSPNTGSAPKRVPTYNPQTGRLE